MEKRVVAYVDGSNFYHLSARNYDLSNIDIGPLVVDLLKNDETLVSIQYFNAPVNRGEEPDMATNQQKYFERIKKYPNLSIVLGKLVRRQITEMHAICRKCREVLVKDVSCPRCGKTIELSSCSKIVEKGVDVNIATNMLVDAFNDKYDVALLFSSDADFVPAIRYVIDNLKKTVIYCRFEKPCTNDLLNACRGRERVITREIVGKHIFQ